MNVCPHGLSAPTPGTPAGAGFNQSGQMGQSVYSEPIQWYSRGKGTRCKEHGLEGFQSLLDHTHAALNNSLTSARVCVFSALRWE